MIYNVSSNVGCVRSNIRGQFIILSKESFLSYKLYYDYCKSLGTLSCFH